MQGKREHIYSLDLTFPKPERRTHAVEVEIGKLHDLSPSEILLAKSLSYGVTEAEVHELYGWKPAAVCWALKMMRRKFAAKNNAQLVAIMMREGILT